MPDIFDDLDPDFPPEEEHDYDKPISEIEQRLLSYHERKMIRHGGLQRAGTYAGPAANYRKPR